MQISLWLLIECDPRNDRLLNGSPNQTLMHVQRRSEKSALVTLVDGAANDRKAPFL